MRRHEENGRKLHAAVRQLLPILVLCALSALVLYPLLRRAHWPLTHERSRYPILLDHFREAFLQGQWYPRWLPRLGGGYGYPTFVFYQPGFFFFALPLALLPIDPLLVFKLAAWALFSLGACGIYFLCRELARAKLALFCAVLFLLTPYLFVELYVRNDLSELLAMVLCPWPLLFALRLDQRVREKRATAAALVGLSTSLTLLLLAHPAVALFAVPTWAAIALYASGSGPASERRAVWLRLAIGFVTALVASSPYWLTVFRMRKYVNMDGLGKGIYVASRHLVHWPQYFSNAWGFGFSMPDGMADAMSFQLGLPHAVLAVVGLVSGWRSRAVRVAFAGYVLLVLLMSTWARFFWSLPVESIRLVQFPWRLLALTGTLQPLCVAGLALHARLGRGQAPASHVRTPLWPLVLFLLVGMVWYREQFFPYRAGIPLAPEIAEKRAMELDSWQWYAQLDEFRPMSVRKRPTLPRGTTPLLEAPPGAVATAAPASTDARLHYHVASPEPCELLLRQSYFPGWRVRIDGRDVPRETLEANLREEGWMRIPVAAGSHTLEARYDGPPGWRWQAMACLLALAAFAVFCWRDRRGQARGELAAAPTQSPVGGGPL